jgi:hypothetical protein
MLEAAAVQKAVGRLETERPDSLSNVLHVLRLLQQSNPCYETRSPRQEEWLELLLDYDKSRAYFGGQSSLIETREGVRCRVALVRESSKRPERQAHPDQLLSVLAELGVPLSRPLSTKDGTQSVKEMLDDSLANFDIQKDELEWSALAYALYLPPQQCWTDKFGRVHTLDDLVEELARRSFEKRACAGTHLLYSLAVMFRADHEAPVLTASTRARLRAYLAGMAEKVMRSQSSDGYWSLDWYLPLSVKGVTKAKREPQGVGEVLVTGHQLEWLLLLPPEFKIPPGSILQAGRWLQVRLLTDPKETLAKQLCPYSHSARVLLALARTREASAAPVQKGLSMHPRAIGLGRKGARASASGGIAEPGSRSVFRERGW